MMRRIRLVGIGLVAAMAMSAIGAASASAEPEFLTKAVVGEAAASNVPFTGTLGATFWEGKTSRAKLTCSSGTVSGEVTGPRSLANTKFVFQGCETAGCPWHTEGLPEGFAETKVLAGKLGAITSTLPGIKLFSQAEGKGGTVMIAEACSGLVKAVMTGEVTGSLAGASGESPQTGKLLSSFKLTFAEKEGSQKYKGFSEGEEAGLLGQLTDTVNGTPELSGWSEIATSKTTPSTWELGITK